MALVETTLSSPLLEAPYAQFLAAVTNPTLKPKTEVERLARSYQGLVGAPSASSLKRHQSELTPLTSHLGQTTGVSSHVTLDGLRDALDFAMRWQDSVLSELSRSVAQGFLSAALDLCPERVLTTEVRNSYYDMIYWFNIVEAAVKASMVGGWIQVGSAFASRRFTIVGETPVGPLLLTHDSVLMHKDMLYSRFLVHLYSVISPGKNETSRLLSSFVSWGEQSLTRLGNKAYEVIKGVEPLSHVRICMLTERWLDSTRQAQDMVQKVQRKEISHGGTGDLTGSLWARLTAIDSPTDVAEVFGFIKLLGHPYVDPRVGVSKVQDLVFNSPPKDPLACKELGYSVCHIYTRGYLAKTGNWPPLKFTYPPGQPPCGLETLSRRRQPVLALGFTQYNPADWEYATFLPHIQFDYGEDTLALLSDRSLSYPRTEFDAVWFGKLDYNPPKPTRSKRVLEDFITRDDIKLPEITKRVQNRDVPFGWKIVSVSPKEREMKLAPRMFAKMVNEMRLFHNNVEKNVKKGIFQYLPEQTMTMSRQELTSRFLETTRPQGGRWIYIHVGIDFSSWNLCWDNENHSAPTGTRLDEIYGVPGVFDYVHDFFSESLSVLDNSDYPPTGLCKGNREDVLHGRVRLDTAYTGHNKGYEGIQQGPWTLSTIALGHMAVWKLGLPFIQSGQGDNQVYSFQIFVPDDISEQQIRQRVQSLTADILKSLEDTATRLGHTIKPEECICSTSFYTYGKEMYVDGVYLPATAKFVSRMFPTTTADTPSVHEYVASVASGGTAATDRSNNSFPIAILTKFVERLTIKRECTRSLLHGTFLHDCIKRAVGDSPRIVGTMIDLLCLVPGNLGGLPISTPLEFLYRGHADPLSSSVSSLLLLSGIPGPDEYLEVLKRPWVYNAHPELDRLIQDPYALPFERSSPPSQAVSAEVRPVFLAKVTNPELTDVVHCADDKARTDLFNWLSSIRPFYPKVVHDLYKGSVVGLVDSFSRMFTNTRTLGKLTTQFGVRLTTVSLNADKVYLSSVVERLALSFKVGLRHEEGVIDVDPRDVYWYCKSLRDRWGIGELEGVTNLHPLWSGSFRAIPCPPWELKLDNTLVVCSQHSSSSVCETSRGPVTPYLGSKTQDKAVGKWIKLSNTSPPIRDTLKILSIQDMMATPGSEFWHSLEKLAQSRCKVDLDIIRKFNRVKVGGTNAHRYLTRDDPKGSFVNISTNWPSHLTISTNLAGTLGRRDYPFDFQEALTLMQGLISWWTSRTSRSAPFGLVLTVDLDKMEEVSDHILQSAPLQALPSLTTDSYYLVVSSLTVSSRSQTAALLSSVALPRLNQHTVGSIPCALISILLNHLTGQLAVGNKFGHTLGKISYRRIIDMPEISLLTAPQFRQALATAVLLKVSLPASLVCNRKTRPINTVFDSLCNTELRRSVPSLYGSIRELDQASWKGLDGVGLGDPTAPRALTRWITATKQILLAPPHRPGLELYLRGSSSLSKLLTGYLGVECLILLTSGSDQHWKAGKQLAKLVGIISNQGDEQEKVHKLVYLVTTLQLAPLPAVVRESPEEVLRQLRTHKEDVSLPTSRIPPVTSVLTSATCPPYPSSSLGLRLSVWHPTAAELVSSWERRGDFMYEAAVTWSPLFTLFREVDLDVLLVGVGDGTIGLSMPAGWRVTGVDLGRTLAQQGHSMVNYTPPHMVQKFTLHPISWTLGGDITDTRVSEYLRDEIMQGRYRLVILDIEGVAPDARLRLRHSLSAPSTPVFVKVLVSQLDLTRCWESFCSLRETSDYFWTSRAYPQNEFIVGGGTSPLCMYDKMRVPSLDDVETRPPGISSVTIPTELQNLNQVSEDIMLLTGDLRPRQLTAYTLGQFPALKSYNRATYHSIFSTWSVSWCVGALARGSVLSCVSTRWV